MLAEDAHSHTKLNGIQQQNELPHSNTVQIQRNQDSSPGHDLACVEEQDNDTYVKVYDIANPPGKRKCSVITSFNQMIMLIVLGKMVSITVSYH